MPQPAVMDQAVSHVDESLVPRSVTMTQKKFVSEFPPDKVYRGEEKLEDYLRISNGRIKTMEELIYVFTHNANPAVHPLLDLVDDEPLEPTAYKSLIASLNTFFAPDGQGDGEAGHPCSTSCVRRRRLLPTPLEGPITIYYR